MESNVRLNAVLTIFFLALTGVVLWDREGISSNMQWGVGEPLFLAAAFLASGTYLFLDVLQGFKLVDSFSKRSIFAIIAGVELLVAAVFIFSELSPDDLVGFGATAAIFIGAALLYYGVEHHS